MFLQLMVAIHWDNIVQKCRLQGIVCTSYLFEDDNDAVHAPALSMSHVLNFRADHTLFLAPAIHWMTDHRICIFITLLMPCSQAPTEVTLDWHGSS